MTETQTRRTLRKPRSDDRLFFDLQAGLFGGQAFVVAYDLGLFEKLAERPMTMSEIGDALALGSRSIDALLVLCTSLGLLERRDDHFALTELAKDYLAPESPTFIGDYLRPAFYGQPNLTSFPTVRKAIVEGRSQIYEGKELFKTHEEEVERAREFTMMMHAHSIGPAMAWPEAFDLSDATSLIDIGGGSGAHAIGAADRWPDLSCTVLEMPVVCDIADEVIASYGLQDRVATMPGDFWNDSLPAADIHFYGDIFHDWPDDKCAGLMRKSSETLKPGGRVMIHEMLYDDAKSGPFVAASMSVIMLAWTEGRQRSSSEYRALLEGAGFVDVETQNTFGHWSVVCARKPA